MIHRISSLVGLIVFWLLLLGRSPLYAADLQNSSGSPADSVVLFHFLPEKEMFYFSYDGNESSIAQASRLIDSNRDLLRLGKAWIAVRGFCASGPSRAANLRMAKIRSNHVKSYFIIHSGMKEDYYRTVNTDVPYQGNKDVVALLQIILSDEDASSVSVNQNNTARRDSLAPLRSDSLERLRADSLERFRSDSLERLRADSPVAVEAAETAVEAERVYVPTPWYIKSNLIYDVLLMPSLEIEYRIDDHWSAAVEGSMAWWHNNGKHKYYQLATIIPEVRYWFKPQGRRRGHYVGLFGGGGWYDLENGGKGYKGEGGMIGVSYGYMFPVGKYLAFEAGAGVGYLTTKYEEYLPLDGHYVYQQTSRTNWFGPVKLKFALVWNIGRWLEKGGRK